MAAYKRVLLKLSGEVFAGEKGTGIDFDSILKYAKDVKDVVQSGTQLGMVIGGGNFWRGRTAPFMDRPTADKMGMLATVMNALIFRDALSQMSVKAIVQSSLAIPNITDSINQTAAIQHLENGGVVIFAGGTGNPFFSTDTAAALRALEIKADLLLKATKVDGVYDSDPEKCKSAQFFPQLSYEEVLSRNLQVMDLTAISLCRENKLPVLVCNVHTDGNLVKAVMGECIGSIVK
jgi:uridylate kinase